MRRALIYFRSILDHTRGRPGAATREQKAVDKAGVAATARRQRSRQLAAAGDASDDDGRRLERERLADNAVGTATTLGEPAAGEGGGDQPDNRDGG